MDLGQVLVMRHAEKADDPLDPDLSPAGRQRALALVRYIPAAFGRPDFLFASAVSKHSRRPLETLEPLSQHCGVPVNAEFADQDYGALAHAICKDIRYEGKLILVSWHHGDIPPLAHALKAKSRDYPDPWDQNVFNLILQFVFAQGILTVRKIIEPF